MSFAPIIPTTGLAGFRLLVATEATQRAVFDRQPEIQRDVDYFTEKIGEVKTAADLVADRRLLRVALGAFGMDEEIDKRAFLRKILEEGTEDNDAFANRFVDPRYKKLANAFGFGNIGGARTGFIAFPAEITDAYKERQFEIAVGEQNETMRLALNFRREIRNLATGPDPEGAGWFAAMGDIPVRRVLEGALGLPADISQIDVDRQRDDFRRAADRVFGSPSLAAFTDEELVDDAIRRFIARRSIDEGPGLATPGATALALLTPGGIGATGLQNLTLSQLR